MPIVPSISTRRISQPEFKKLAFEVLQHVFAIHNEFGRLFDENVYKRELAARMDGVELEVPVDATHRTFNKRYFADVIVRGCGLFEFKAADAVIARHRGQAIHYLRLFDLAHGKIINLRPEKVEHEFVNCQQRLADSRNPTIRYEDWDNTAPGAAFFRDTLIALVCDWGTGLDLALYEDAMTHFLGGEEAALSRVPVFGTSGHIGDQWMRLAAPGVIFKLTALSTNVESFANHARKLLRHTSAEAIQWANITHTHVTLTTLR